MALSMNRHKLKANRQTEIYQTVMHDLIGIAGLDKKSIEEYIGFPLKFPDDPTVVTEEQGE